MKLVSRSQIVLPLSVFVLVLVVAAASANAQLYFGTPVNLGPNINTSSADGAIISPDGCTLYMGLDRSGGYGGYDVYVATRASTDDDWGPAVHLGQPMNTTSNDIPWSVSSDGLTLYLYSDRPGGYGGWDLWRTTRTTTSATWGTPVNLGSTVNSSSMEYQANVSGDNLSLYFTSNRGGGYGGFDLWVAKRATASSAWGTPVNLGATVNSPSGDYQPSISADGLLLFFTSMRPGGFGPDDIYVTARPTVSDPWGTPVNLGPVINTPAEDFCPSISADGSTLYFVSSGHGGYGYYDVFRAPIY